MRLRILAALGMIVVAGCARKSPLAPQGGANRPAAQPVGTAYQAWQPASAAGPAYQGRAAAHWANDLHRPDPVTRAEAGRALASLGEDGYTHLRAGLRSPSADVRLTAIRSLPQPLLLAHQQETTPLLLAFVRDSDPELRREAVVRLGWFGQDGRGFLPLLRNVMAGDGDSGVREAALVTIDSIEQAISGVSKVNPQ